MNKMIFATLLAVATLGSCTKKDTTTESDVMLEEPAAELTDSAAVPMPEAAVQDTVQPDSTSVK